MSLGGHRSGERRASNPYHYQLKGTLEAGRSVVSQYALREGIYTYVMNMLEEHECDEYARGTRYLPPSIFSESECSETNINLGLYAQIRKRQSKTQPIGTLSLAI